MSVLVARRDQDRFELTVAPLLRDSLIGVVRKVRLGLAPDNPAVWRLTPPSYSDPVQEAEAGLKDEAGNELTQTWDRLSWAEDVLGSPRLLEREELDRLCVALNLARLVLHETPDRGHVQRLDPYDLVSAVVGDLLDALME